VKATARSEARAADQDYRHRAPMYRIGDRVLTVHGVGVIEFIANSNAMDSPLYTVDFDSRMKVRLLERNLKEAS
jgi:RNA polymerase-interacting CarD/CdnL/TRCF family regulator